jgi:Ca-activated chloride channel homolog
MSRDFGIGLKQTREPGSACFAATALAFVSAIMWQVVPGLAQDSQFSPCAEDAVLVFDASGSMSGNGWGYGSESAHNVSRIDRVRYALGKVLPTVTRHRRVGLVTYGPTRTPSLFNQCDNIELDLPPTPNAAAQIMASVESLVPAGGTPLTRAVEQAAEMVDFESEPGLIVLLTDGEDTCGGSPCQVGKELHAAAAQLTIHVIGLRVKGLSWTGESNIVETQCLAEQNEGLYLTPENTDDLIDALEMTLGCPKISRLMEDQKSHIEASSGCTWSHPSLCAMIEKTQPRGLRSKPKG